ncbi:MAG: DUF4401 domain-containing protein [bacterium]
MIKKSLTIKELLEHPKVRHTVSKEDIDCIVNKLRTDEAQPKDPIYIRILSGIGAWFAAIFIIIFLFLSHLIKNGTGAIIIGLILFSGAIIIARASKVTFPQQLSLALAIVSNILLLYGFSEINRNFSLLTLAILQAVICVVIYPLFSNSIYRYLAPIGFVILATAWIVKEQRSHSIHVLIAAEMLLFGILILQRKRQNFLAPLMYSAATMLPATLLFLNLTQINLWRINFQSPLWISSIIIAAGIIYLFINLAGGLNHLREPWLMMTIFSTILLGIFTTPGVLVAISLLVMGYNYGDRILSGLAYLFLPNFLLLYYYALNVDLAFKSWVLAGSGLLLLAVRFIADRFLRPRKEIV